VSHAPPRNLHSCAYLAEEGFLLCGLGCRHI